MSGSAVDPTGLSVDIRATRGTFTVDAAFEVAAGGCLAMLGPNGAGKSTILSMIAGLADFERGTVRLGGRVLARHESGEAPVVVAPEHRRVGLMGQDPLLFPHLSALENVAFGPRAQGSSRRAARLLAGDWLARMGLGQFADRRPAQLSGGQRQRVALARALAAAPDLLLLDEPLGALDARTAPEIRQVVRTHLRETGTTSVLVTHDALDAAMLADRIIVLDAGRIVDEGATASVLTAPRSEFGAALAGLNLLTGSAEESAAAGSIGTVLTGVGVRVSGIVATTVVAGGPAAAVFPPSAVAVYSGAVDGSPRNQWCATVASMQAGTAAIRLLATVTPAGDVGVDLTPAAVAELGLSLGSQVFLVVKATEVRIHPR